MYWSFGSRSNKDSKQRQVCPRQCQVASLFSTLSAIFGAFTNSLGPGMAKCCPLILIEYPCFSNYASMGSYVCWQLFLKIWSIKRAYKFEEGPPISFTPRGSTTQKTHPNLGDNITHTWPPTGTRLKLVLNFFEQSCILNCNATYGWSRKFTTFCTLRRFTAKWFWQICVRFS